jgi:hypothetical protein
MPMGQNPVWCLSRPNLACPLCGPVAAQRQASRPTSSSRATLFGQHHHRANTPLAAVHLALNLESLQGDERLGLDFLRGRGKSISRHLDIDDEGFEQNFKLLRSLNNCSLGYESVQHELTSPRRLIPTSAVEKTSKNEVDAI